jgi:two-component system, cell cycle sensor histidine kinase and response regulator CckA
MDAMIKGPPAPNTPLRTGAEFTVLFAENPLAMCLLDAETGRFVEVNDAAVALYGYAREELHAMRVDEIQARDEINRLLGSRSTDAGPFRPEGVWRHRRKDGSTIAVEIYSRVVDFRERRSMLLLLRNTSEQRRLEQQLLHAQRMEAVGRLAAGIAHDFNNLLTAVLGYTDFLLDNPELPPSVAADAFEIRQAATSAAELTRQLLSFGSKQLTKPIAVNINPALERLERMLHRVIGEDIMIVMRLDPAIKNVCLYPGQFEQIVVNFAINARDAMPRGGTLTIETSMHDPDDADGGGSPDAVRAEHVMMAVCDTGEGIDAQLLPHIFEPFFTTKHAGKGTGLGLATVYGIVTQNDGSISVSSEPGRGTAFKVYFPAIDGEGHVRAVTSEPSTRGGTETILVVEDNAPLRQLTERALNRLGYTVLTAATGAEALRVAAWPQREIDLLFSDVVLPDIPGPELASHMRAARPALKVLLASGYGAGMIADHGVAADAVFLAKPFTTDSLARKIRDILDH